MLGDQLAQLKDDNQVLRDENKTLDRRYDRLVKKKRSESLDMSTDSLYDESMDSTASSGVHVNG